MGVARMAILPLTERSGDMRVGTLFYLLDQTLLDDASVERVRCERAGLSGTGDNVPVCRQRMCSRVVAR